ncbi:MAG TPA: hypothetical protein VIE88_02265, partial [Vicinamibacteria bacterium]
MKTFRASFMTGLALQLLTGPIHLAGQLSGPPAPASEDEKLLMDLMQRVEQDFGLGFVRSTLDIVTGLGFQYSIFMVMVGVTNLIALRMVKDGRFLRALAWVNVVFMGILAVNAYVYLFIAPL